VTRPPRGGDADLASGSWTRPRSWRVFGLRLVHLNVGLLLFGLSIALMLNGRVGLPAWDVFHQGVALRTPLTIGQAMILAGLALILVAWRVAQVRPGIGTVFNMATIGLWVDLFLGWPRFPAADGGAAGWGLFAAGLLLNGLATGLYITAGLGAGPRDGFALALADRLSVPVRRARTGVELVVLASGWALGGTVGLGTLVFAVAIGPLMQSGLRLTQGLRRAYARSEREAPPVPTGDAPT
jgi:uncharacterized membrane protein YczE